ncbi:hypothetical protein K502DRAFT_330946 [Neoconidiobolus thromboides FSU 785]|nr:hypothetical protein K502DRAFT_330946 [Neoconidiobolus thromboides FSU 785]
MAKLKKFQLKKAKPAIKRRKPVVSAPQEPARRAEEPVEPVIPTTQPKKGWDLLNINAIKRYQKILEQAQLITLQKSQKKDEVSSLLFHLISKLSLNLSKIRVPQNTGIKGNKLILRRDVHGLESVIIKELETLTVLRKSILAEENRVKELELSYNRIKNNFDLLNKKNNSLNKQLINPILLGNNENNNKVSISSHPIMENSNIDQELPTKFQNSINNLNKSISELATSTTPLQALIDHVARKLELFKRNS